MLKNNKNILTILDICSSKVVCIIAKCESNNNHTILGLGYVKADGIRGGIVSDCQLAQISIRNAVSLAQKNAGVQSSRAHVAISANYLVSQRITTEIIIFSKEITHRELNKLLLEAIQICKNQKLRVIHTFVCNYILDGHHGITNPIGMFGTKLACEFHILAAATSSILNLDAVISKAGFEVESYISSTYSAGLSALTKDDIENGAILLDFGAEVTSIGVFENDQLILVDAISIGGKHITRDIAKILCIPKAEAERVKNLYGSAINSNIDLHECINVKVHGENTTINRNQLIDIMHARIEEILNMIVSKIQDFKISNFIITGGTARIPHLRDLIADRFKTKVRIGYPQGVMQSHNHSLELVTSLGIIQHIGKNIEDITSTLPTQVDTKWINQYINWIKRNFF